MYSTAAASGGATQGPTISADSAPIAATPASEPPRWRSLNRPSFDRSAAGSCSSYRPNDDSASATNSSANSAITHGTWNATCRLAPTSPATTPATVNTSALASTSMKDSRSEQHTSELQLLMRISYAV